MDVEGALVWAERTRAFRDAFVARCADGLDLAGVRAELAADPDRLAELRLLGVLEAMPAVGGKVVSRRLMAAAGLAEDVELGDVGDAAWAAIVAGATS